MKHILLTCLLCLFVSGFVNAQTPVDTVVNSNGKRVVLMSDNTWHFVGEKTWIKNTNIRKGKSSARKTSLSSSSSTSYSSSGYCGARTKKGGSCRRKVRGGGYCWQHS